MKIRSDHSALNLLFQGAASVIMKKAILITHEKLQALGLKDGEDYLQVLFCHDALTFEVKEQYAELVGKTIVEAIKEAGEYLKFKCPLDGDYHIGNNYAEVH